jgi:hypothetical protein
MDPRRGRVLAPAIIIALGVLIRVPQLSHSLNEFHSFRQTQTAWVAREYAEHGINLWHTPLPVFGRGSDVPMEVPLVQALGALVMRAGVNPDLATRLVGLSGFVVTGVLLAVLVTRWHGMRVACLSLAVLQLCPNALAWGASSLIEYWAVACGLAMVCAIDLWFRGRRWPWLVVGAACAVLLFSIKVTTAPVYCVLLFFAALAVARTSVARATVGLAAAGIPGAAAAAAWTSYADTVKQHAVLTHHLVSDALTEWNFGTAEQRHDPSIYLGVWIRVSAEVTGVLPLAVIGCVGAIALSRGPDRVRTSAWLAAAAAGPLIFLNLYDVHSYYLSAITPCLAVACGIGLEVCLRLPQVRHIGRAIVVSAVVGSLATTMLTTNGPAEVRQWRHGRPAPVAATHIANTVPKGEVLMMVGCGWNPTIAYYASRTALYLRDPDEAAAYWREHSVSEFHWLYRCRDDVRPADYFPDETRLVPTLTPRLTSVHQALPSRSTTP